MPKFRDTMFGKNIQFGQRVARHRRRHNGLWHEARLEPARPLPHHPVTLLARSAGSPAFSVVQVCYTLNGSDPVPENPAAHSLNFATTTVTWDDITWGYVQHWQVQIPAQPEGTLLRYAVRGKISGSEHWRYADSQAEQFSARESQSIWFGAHHFAEWGEQARIYHIFLDRFNPGAGRAWLNPPTPNGFYGGTLRGVIEKLPYLQQLGFNALWLSPFFPNSTHHGYDAADYFGVEPRFGTQADMDELIAQAHAHGFKLILDFVANHCSNLHPNFQEAQRDPNSPYHNWFQWREWPHTYEAFFDVKELPAFNLTWGSGARQYLLDAARHWLERGFDGYRLDYAYGPPLDFWVHFRQVCRTANPECLLFGETIHTADEQLRFSTAFDGSIDFLLADALRKTFALREMSLPAFEAFLNRHETAFAGKLQRFTMLDNHDMNRFLFLAGNDKAALKLAALVLYTLSGSPIVYTGTETGVTQERPTHYDGRGVFEEARLPIRWETADSDLQAHFTQLNALRRDHPLLADAPLRTVHLTNTVYAYQRATGRGSLLIVINTAAKPATLNLPAEPAAYAPLYPAAGEPLHPHNGKITLQIPARSGIVLHAQQIS